MITTREALTGPWAASPRGWLVAVVPGSLIVVAQELATPAPPGLWIAVSVVLQLVAVSAWAVLVSSIARLLTGRMPAVALGLLWVGIGVWRGVIGALVASEAGAPPEWAYRIGFWVVVSVCWMPLLTYALAQWEEHRRLLAERAAVAEAVDLAAVQAAEGDDARAHRLAAAADDALGPGLDEVRAALNDHADLDPQTAKLIATRLDELAARAGEYTTPPPVPQAPRSSGRVSVSAASREFELRRPVFASLLTAADTAPILLPEALRQGGWIAAIEMTIAIVVATGILIAAFGLMRSPRLTARRRSLGSRLGVIGAGVAGAGVLTAFDVGSFDIGDLLLILLFPLVLASAASATATAVALEATNVDLDHRIARDRAALDDLRRRVSAADEEAAIRLQTLVRGDLNGRLASSAMALGFLANGDVLPETGPRVVRGVLDQLDAAAAELHVR